MQKNWLLSGLLVAFLFSCGGNKSEMITKDWKATELVFGEKGAETKLNGDAVGGVFFSFKADSTFSYTETGSIEKGKWNLDSDKNQIILKYTEGDRTVTQDIKELTAEKLVLYYEDHGMKRNVTLVPGAK